MPDLCQELDIQRYTKVLPSWHLHSLERSRWENMCSYKRTDECGWPGTACGGSAEKENFRLSGGAVTAFSRRGINLETLWMSLTFADRTCGEYS